MGGPMPPQQQQMPQGGPQAGMVRSADEMMEGADENAPPAKRVKVPELPAGQYYTEQDWINMHPVRVPQLSLVFL